MKRKIKRLGRIFRKDRHPVRRIMGMVISKLPFDLGKFFNITVNVHDFKINLRQSSLSIAYWCDPKSRVMDYTFITSYLKKEDTYLDVGANIGTTLIPAGKIVRPGNALGFEPHPRIFALMEENISLNDMQERVKTFNCALGSEKGEIQFSSDRDDDTNRVLTTGTGVTVEVKTLDEITDGIERVNLLKVDVEGYEKFVFEGGGSTLQKTECVYFEISEEHFSGFGYSVKDLLEILQDSGFGLYMFEKLGELKPIDSDYRLTGHHANVVAVRDVRAFSKRTGWRVCEPVEA